MAVRPIPVGYHSVTPYLLVSGVPRLLEFLSEAFDATLALCVRRPDGSIGHAEVRVGDSPIMLGEATGHWGPCPSMLFVYVEDVDAAHARAIRAGGVEAMPVADQSHGDRMGGVLDPSGNTWWIASRVEDLSPEELQRREDARHASAGPA